MMIFATRLAHCFGQGDLEMWKAASNCCSRAPKQVQSQLHINNTFRSKRETFFFIHSLLQGSNKVQSEKKFTILAILKSVFV